MCVCVCVCVCVCMCVGRGCFKCRLLRDTPNPKVKPEYLWEWSPDTDPRIGSVGEVIL